MKTYCIQKLSDLAISTSQFVAGLLTFNRLRTTCRVLIASMLLGMTASAQYAPDSLVIPTTISWAGICNDSWDGLISEGANATIISPNTIYTATHKIGTYTYAKTGPDTAIFTYTRIWLSFDGDSETENGTVNVVFTSATGGTYTSSGSYTGVESEEEYAGYWVNGAGAFTYTSVSEQYAPESFESTSKLSWTGTCIDSWDDLISEGESITAGPTNTYTANNVTGTYKYTKTGPNTASVGYSKNWTFGGNSETEYGSVKFVFTSASGGIYTSTGNYTGLETGNLYVGYWTDGEGLFTYTPEKIGDIKVVKGTVTRNGFPKPLKVNDPIYKNDIITTGKRSFVQVVLLDQSKIQLASESSEKFVSCKYSGPDPTILEHIRGLIRAYVKKDNDPSIVKFIIHVKNYAMGVRGTEFTVEYEEVDSVATTSCSVFEGIVDVTEFATGQLTTLTAGGRWQSNSNLAEPAFFSSDAVTADERTGSVELSVSGGNPTGVTSIAYWIVPGTATAGLDYTPPATMPRRIAWTNTMGERTITIPVKKDALIEDDETFYVLLGNPTNCVITEPRVCKVTVTDANSGLTLADALDNTALVWTTVGTPAWAPQRAAR